MKIFIIKLLILVSLLSGQIIAQNPGDLDVSFGESGIVKSEIGQRSKIHTIALQQDTKILAAGEYGPPNDTPRIVIARYHNNGQLDQNFGNLGVVVLPTLINQFEKANSILIQNNGKIIVGCIVTGLPGTTNGSVYIRLNPDGSIDESYGNNGMLYLQDVLLWSASIDAYNNILGCAFQQEGFKVFKINDAGALDVSFGDNGFISVLPSSTEYTYARSTCILIQPDSKFIVAGIATHPPSNRYDYAVARFHEDGSLDNSFGINGFSTFNWDIPGKSKNKAINSLAIQSDGKIIAAGFISSIDGNYQDFVVIRLRKNGTIDNTFSQDGMKNCNFGQNSNTEAFDVGLQSDNKIVVTGLDWNLSAGTLDRDFIIVRLHSNGEYDNNFGINGVVFTDIQDDGASFDYSTELLIQEDQKIIIAGSSGPTVFENQHFTMARYISDVNVINTEELHKLQTIIIYPNPVHNNFAVEYSLLAANNISIDIFNSFGNFIAPVVEEKYQDAGNYYQMINLNKEIPSGVYCLVFTVDGKQRITKWFNKQ